MRGPIPLGRQLLLLERIAVGGMAEVYRAKSFGTHGFERVVAVKRILASMAEDEEFVRMFVDEARLASSLTHQNIVQIYDFGQQDKLHYIAMEYVAGRDLRTILDRHKKLREPMNPAMACTVIAKVAEALDYAHRKRDPSGKEVKIIHRDVSPQNVLLSFDGEVKLCDFGIAKAVTQSTRTQVGVLKGKFAYMSPEQVRGRQIDRRSDVFALGVIFYEMLTGERLFLGESDYSTLEAVRSARVPPPRQFNPSLPPKLEEICLKMLTREPADRYQWASDVLEDVTRFLFASGQVFHAHHLRQYMQDAYAADIDAENAKQEAFAAVRMPPPSAVEEPKGVASMLEGMGLVAKRSEPDAARIVEGESVPGPAGAVSRAEVTVEEPSSPLIKAAAGTPSPPKKRPVHDDLSTTVMADDEASAESAAARLPDPESSTIAEDATGDLAKEIQAAQAALIERLSTLGEAATVDVGDKTGGLPPLPRIISKGADDPMFDPVGGVHNTLIEDPAEDDAGRTGETWSPNLDAATPEVVPKPEPPPRALEPARPVESTRPAEIRKVPTVASGVPVAAASRQIKERARPDQTPPPRPAQEGYGTPTPTPPLQLTGRTPVGGLMNLAPEAPLGGVGATMAAPLGAMAAPALGPPIAIAPGSDRANPKLLLAGAALVVLVTIAFLAIVLWSQRATDASLLVETTPVREARVLLDGHVMSEQTPVEIGELKLGEHTIEIRATGYHVYRQTFTIAEKRPHTLSIPLDPIAPKPAPATPAPTPAGAAPP